MTATDIVALYGAIVATSVLIFDIYKHRASGPLLDIDVIRDDAKAYFIIRITNRGGRRAKLKYVAIAQFPLGLLKKHTIVYGMHDAAHKLPVFLEPGDEWVGSVEYSKLTSLKPEGGLYVFAYRSYPPHPDSLQIVANTNDLPALQRAQIQPTSSP